MTTPVHAPSRSQYVRGCHCPGCRKAQAEYMQTWKARGLRLSPSDPRHGTLNGYGNYSCRCRQCRAANAAKSRARRIAEQAGDPSGKTRASTTVPPQRQPSRRPIVMSREVTT